MIRRRRCLSVCLSVCVCVCVCVCVSVCVCLEDDEVECLGELVQFTSLVLAQSLLARNDDLAQQHVVVQWTTTNRPQTHDVGTQLHELLYVTHLPCTLPSHNTRYKTTNSAIPEGLCDALVCRNIATTKHPNGNIVATSCANIIK